jgi:predicted TPR repeat methyltransferase
MLLAQSGHVTEAMEQYQQALQIDPDDDKARQGLAKLQQLEMQQNAPGPPAEGSKASPEK